LAYACETVSTRELAVWGPGDPPADLDGSGSVDVADLLILLARIPRDLPPILDHRLALDARCVVEEGASLAEWFGRVLGTRASCAAEAARCDRRRLVSALRLDDAEAHRPCRRSRAHANRVM
jgi:hypothetical protein